MSAGISREAWLKAIDEATAVHDTANQDALTAPEYAELFDVHIRTAQKHVNLLVKQGKAERVFKWVRRADSSRVKLPAYRLKERKK